MLRAAFRHLQGLNVPVMGLGFKKALIHQPSGSLPPFRSRNPQRHKAPAASRDGLLHNTGDPFTLQETKQEQVVGPFVHGYSSSCLLCKGLSVSPLASYANMRGTCLLIWLFHNKQTKKTVLKNKSIHLPGKSRNTKHDQNVKLRFWTSSEAYFKQTCGSNSSNYLFYRNKLWNFHEFIGTDRWFNFGLGHSSLFLRLWL